MAMGRQSTISTGNLVACRANENLSKAPGNIVLWTKEPDLEFRRIRREKRPQRPTVKPALVGHARQFWRTKLIVFLSIRHEVMLFSICNICSQKRTFPSVLRRLVLDCV